MFNIVSGWYYILSQKVGTWDIILHMSHFLTWNFLESKKIGRVALKYNKAMFLVYSKLSNNFWGCQIVLYFLSIEKCQNLFYG